MTPPMIPGGRSFRGVCRGPNCGREVDMREVRRGNDLGWHPFDVDSPVSHFGTCIDARGFRDGRRPRGPPEHPHDLRPSERRFAADGDLLTRYRCSVDGCHEWQDRPVGGPV